jgi:hypothetical protein
VLALAKSPTVDRAAVADFRAYAGANGVAIPVDAATDDQLGRALIRTIAFVKFGAEGYYQLLALTDPVVRTSVDSFAKAAQLLGPGAAP